MGTMKVMSKRGHDVVEWDVENEQSVDLASEFFRKSLEEEGMRAFEVDPEIKGESKMVDKFNPLAAEIILIMPMAGG